MSKEFDLKLIAILNCIADEASVRIKYNKISVGYRKFIFLYYRWLSEAGIVVTNDVLEKMLAVKFGEWRLNAAAFACLTYDQMRSMIEQTPPPIPDPEFYQHDVGLSIRDTINWKSYMKALKAVMLTYKNQLESSI